MSLLALEGTYLPMKYRNTVAVSKPDSVILRPHAGSTCQAVYSTPLIIATWLVFSLIAHILLSCVEALIEDENIENQ